jgi:hypothetical protein
LVITTHGMEALMPHGDILQGAQQIGYAWQAQAVPWRLELP